MKSHLKNSNERTRSHRKLRYELTARTEEQIQTHKHKLNGRKRSESHESEKVQIVSHQTFTNTRLAKGAQRVPRLVLNWPFLVSSYVLDVTAFLTFGISNRICVTVCMQDKFEPTSVGKNPWILLSECPINVRPCVQGIRLGCH